MTIDNNDKDTPVSNLADVAGEDGKPMTGRKDSRLVEAAEEIHAMMIRHRDCLSKRMSDSAHESHFDYGYGFMDALCAAHDVLIRKIHKRDKEGDYRDVAV